MHAAVMLDAADASAHSHAMVQSAKPVLVFTRPCAGIDLLMGDNPLHSPWSALLPLLIDANARFPGLFRARYQHLALYHPAVGHALSGSITRK